MWLVDKKTIEDVTVVSIERPLRQDDGNGIVLVKFKSGATKFRKPEDLRPPLTL